MEKGMRGMRTVTARRKTPTGFKCAVLFLATVAVVSFSLSVLEGCEKLVGREGGLGGGKQSDESRCEDNSTAAPPPTYHPAEADAKQDDDDVQGLRSPSSSPPPSTSSLNPNLPVSRHACAAFALMSAVSLTLLTMVLCFVRPLDSLLPNSSSAASSFTTVAGRGEERVNHTNHKKESHGIIIIGDNCLHPHQHESRTNGSAANEIDSSGNSFDTFNCDDGGSDNDRLSHAFMAATPDDLSGEFDLISSNDNHRLHCIASLPANVIRGVAAMCLAGTVVYVSVAAHYSRNEGSTPNFLTSFYYVAVIYFASAMLSVWASVVFGSRMTMCLTRFCTILAATARKQTYDVAGSDVTSNSFS